MRGWRSKRSSNVKDSNCAADPLSLAHVPATLLEAVDRRERACLHARRSRAVGDGPRPASRGAAASRERAATSCGATRRARGGFPRAVRAQRRTAATVIRRRARGHTLARRPDRASRRDPRCRVVRRGAGAADDVAFHSGDDVQFPTAERVAIPIDGKSQHAGGSVSLWVQPGWERGNEDDATLVQLGDRVRLAKSVHFLRLEAADAEATDAGEVAGVDVPITEWNPGEWHQVTATWSDHALPLYVDGELVGRRMGRGHVDLPPDTELLVGSDLAESRRVAPGLIGRVDVRSRPLEDDEVARDYQDAVGEDERPARGNGPDERGNGPHDRGKGSDDRGEGSDRGHSHGTDRGTPR